MHINQPHYLPLAFPFFSILVGVFVFLLVLLQVGALRYAYMRIGLSAGGAMLVLLSLLIGSYFNIPLTELPAFIRLFRRSPRPGSGWHPL